jgi:ring-1,2-phenylacetyl-CoA epoxidase subunit PaaC
VSPSTKTDAWTTAEQLPEEARGATGDLILLLADNKRVLGMRYSDWILGAPSVEAGIACSAMAQDEWGHSRILYALLRDFGFDPKSLEHDRDAAAYRNSELIDSPLDGWPGLIAVNLLLDTALSVQFEALGASRFEPLHYKVRKLLEEERFHFEHARGWVTRLSGTEAGRDALSAAFEPVWAACLRWFGPADDPLGTTLAAAGVADAGPDELRQRWLARVAPVVRDAGLGLAEAAGDAWTTDPEPDWRGWDSSTRRSDDAAGLDAATLASVRGDKNRSMLLD